MKTATSQTLRRHRLSDLYQSVSVRFDSGRGLLTRAGRVADSIALAAFSCLALAVTAACTKQDGIRFEDGRKPIQLSAVAECTKSVVTGITMPESYTVYVSAHFTSHTAPETDCDYFVAEPFRPRQEMWTAEPTLYWPAGGELDFLAIACEDSALDIQESVIWHEGDCSNGIELTLKDGECLNSEILFAAACSRAAGNGSVPMLFKHSQSWLQFVINTDTGILRIDGIVLENVYSGGLFRVSNNVYLDAGWTFRGHRRTDIVLPGSECLIPEEGKPSICDILVPEQDACDIVINYSVKNSPTDDWTTARHSTYRHKAGADPWFYGEKNVFRIGFSFTEITMETFTRKWTELSEDITVNNWNAPPGI